MKKLLQAVGFCLCFANIADAHENGTDETNETIVREANIQLVPFIPVKITQKELQSICEQVKNDCKGDQHYVYRTKKTNHFYYINDVPQFAILDKTDNGYQVSRQWAFHEYPIRNQKTYSHSNEELPFTELKISPSLYIIDDGEGLAIALRKVFYKHYSEGESLSEMADIVYLENYDYRYDVMFENIPFYQKEQKRACFTPEEYKQSPHCYNEFSRTLNIKFYPSPDGLSWGDWGLFYTDKTWVAHQPKSEQKIKHNQPIFVRPYQAAILEWATEENESEQ